MYDALKMHEETKQFESYLLIKSRIENECRNGVKCALLQKLDQKYLAGGREDELMDVLRMMN